MPKSYDYVICGGGFKGAVASILLARKGLSVCLIEASPRLGGVLNTMPWNGFELDIGCHLFDNSTAGFTDLMFEIHEDFIPIEVRYNSVVCEGKVTEGMAVPDLTQLDLDSKSVEASLQAALGIKDVTNIETYADHLNTRFGSYIAEHLSTCAQKKVGINPQELSPLASASVLLDRIKCLDDELSLKLKEEAEYDSRLAVSSQNSPMKFYEDAAKHYPHRNYYPGSGGMGAFCRSLESFVEDVGVEIIFQDQVTEITGDCLKLKSNESVRAGNVLWTNHLSVLEQVLFRNESISQVSKDVSAVLLYFEVAASDISDITYMHDYRADSPAFRLSTAGKYGNQMQNGTSFVCAEAFVPVDSKIWALSDENYLDVWAQLNSSGVVTCDLPLSVKALHAKSAYKLPGVTYETIVTNFIDRATEEFPMVLIDNSVGFSKQTMYEQALTLAESV